MYNMHKRTTNYLQRNFKKKPRKNRCIVTFCHPTKKEKKKKEKRWLTCGSRQSKSNPIFPQVVVNQSKSRGPRERLFSGYSWSDKSTVAAAGPVHINIRRCPDLMVPVKANSVWCRQYMQLYIMCVCTCACQSHKKMYVYMIHEPFFHKSDTCCFIAYRVGFSWKRNGLVRRGKRKK